MAAGTDFSLSSMTLRLIMALVMGAIIGVDRESAGHPAGVRTFALILFVILVLTPLSHTLDETNRRVEVYLEVDRGDNIPVLFDFIQSKEYSLSNLQKMKSQSVLKDDIAIIFTVDMGRRRMHESLLEEISALPYVHYVAEIK